MHKPAPQVSVFGAAHIDVEMRLLGDWHEGASNPVTRFERIGGVACNVAAQLASCCDTHLFTAIGNDSQGQQITRELAARGITVNSFPTGHSTGTYVAVLDADGELRAGLADTAAIETVEAHHLQQFVQDGKEFQQQQAVCFDCNCSESLIEAICATHQQNHPSTVTRPILAALGVSPAKIGKLLIHARQIDILFANRAELATLAQCEITASPETLLGKLNETGFGQIVATDGAGDTAILNDGTVTRLPVPALTTISRDYGHSKGRVDRSDNQKYSVNGAGDALAAATLAALLQNKSLFEAVRDYGFAAASRQMFRRRQSS